MNNNRLAQEKSPYLQQHKQNPVDWFPWGEEAFAKARQEDKPIFLSVGYSTCHWCHVMERESFESEEVAAVLNRSFVSIKVDREERPDVDRVYMTFIQASTGSGGWPMSVWLTPGLKPFFGGTYFPPDDRYGRPGFRQILDRLALAWQTDRMRIEESGTQVLQQLQGYTQSRPSSARLDEALAESCYYQFRRSFDPRYGGFGGAPKFPRAATFNFLLRWFERTRNEEAADMVTTTLREMVRGGIHDHLGGGFHRYSVDARWFVPHFEKMLYDQAQLAISYLEAFQVSQDPLFAATARRILDYVLEEMTNPEGGFFSAEDADSVADPEKPHDKAEGAFYVWTRAELDAILGPSVAGWFSYRYGVEADGNVREDPHNEFPGKNILYEARSLDETAAAFSVTPFEVQQALEHAHALLLDERSRRIRPHLDDKVLASWNGLMISAFARAGATLGETAYLDAAARAASFLDQHMQRDGVILRRYREGEAAIDGFLDDYAFVAQAMLDLFEATGEESYLAQARQLVDRAIFLFEDRDSGGFFTTAGEGTDLVLRLKDDYDGAEPSGNAIMALTLLRLGRLLDHEPYLASAARTLQAASSMLSSSPTSVPQMMVALLFSLSPPRQVILLGDRESTAGRAFIDSLQRRFLPNHAVVWLSSETARDALSPHLPALRQMRLAPEQVTVYVCENFTCQLPVTEVRQLDQLLQ